MDLEERESAENQSAGDTKLINLISLKDDAVSTGLALAIGLGDGKCSKAIFDMFSVFPIIIVEAFLHGFQIMGILQNKETKSNDTIAYMTFKKEKIAEYFFFPKNIRTADGKPATSLTFCLSTSQINSALKKGKATTIMRFEWNVNQPKICLSITNGASTIPYYLDTQFIASFPCPLPSNIVNPKLEPNFKMTAELFSAAMSTASLKYDNHAYDFTFTIHTNGITVHTKAPGVGKLSYGNTSDPGIEFLLENSASKLLCKVHKITPRGTVLVTSLDKNVFKITLPIASCGDGFIFQFPKPVNLILPNQSAPQLQYTQEMQQNYGQQRQISYIPQCIPQQVNNQQQWQQQTVYQQQWQQMQNSNTMIQQQSQPQSQSQNPLGV
jgi:hypothetical protein